VQVLDILSMLREAMVVVDINLLSMLQEAMVVVLRVLGVVVLRVLGVADTMVDTMAVSLPRRTIDDRGAGAKFMGGINTAKFDYPLRLISCEEDLTAHASLPL
jgi:hypothetical protein